MSPWDEANLHAVLARVDGPPAPDDQRAQAAVAALLRPGPDGAEVLLMQRAQRAGDPWSGHVSLPGGRREPGDPDLATTAMREAHEELAVELAAHAALVGVLPTVPATAKGKILPMSITPFVFVQRTPVAPRVSAEAVGHFWMPLDAAARGAFDDVLPYQTPTTVLNLPCWRYDGHAVWGLTYRVVRSLLEELRLVDGRSSTP